MAILYRNNRQAAYLSIMLMANKIPFHSNDPVISPYEHWIFQDVLSFYRLAEGIGTVNDLRFRSVIDAHMDLLTIRILFWEVKHDLWSGTAELID